TWRAWTRPSRVGQRSGIPLDKQEGMPVGGGGLPAGSARKHIVTCCAAAPKATGATGTGAASKVEVPLRDFVRRMLRSAQPRWIVANGVSGRRPLFVAPIWTRGAQDQSNRSDSRGFAFAARCAGSQFATNATETTRAATAPKVSGSR